MTKVNRIILTYIFHTKYTKAALILGMLLFLFIMQIHAQPPTDPGGGVDVDAPIDGGLSLLVAAGIGYGANKMKQRKKTIKE